MVKLIFNADEHKYYDENGNRFLSVTQLIEKVVPKFNEDFWLVYKALERIGYKKLYPKEWVNMICVNGVDKYVPHLLFEPEVKHTVGVIKQEWIKTNRIACEKGNIEHNYLEEEIKKVTGVKAASINDLLFTGESSELHGLKFKDTINSLEELENSNLKVSHTVIYERLKKFIKAGAKIYTEIRVYHKDYRIAGTIDLLIVKGDVFCILDWKTNKDTLKFTSGYYKKAWVTTASGERVKVVTDEFVYTNDSLEEPLGHISHCKGSIYTLQLSLYAYLLECFGFSCSALELYHIRELEYGKDVQSYKIEYIKDDVRTLLEWQKVRNTIVKPIKFGFS
jgi:hypothetical protein